VACRVAGVVVTATAAATAAGIAPATVIVGLLAPALPLSAPAAVRAARLRAKRRLVVARDSETRYDKRGGFGCKPRRVGPQDGAERIGEAGRQCVGVDVSV
jgi:hypothetical protein